ncbi:type I restriction endonuclease subunit R [Candidatus Nanohalovita haloferacivicina]|uniref:type I restriction endonuclease subunit R n=1 Tax=Candidatus Nanohalovita haloferacivicina TaxID=2978046 RepID=UPI00325FB6C8|nr:Type I restriction enzyme, R subunit [Candidatus Nanohalobia archaeon BNXNv]
MNLKGAGNLRQTTEGGVEAKVLDYLEDVGWDVYGDPKNNGEWGGSQLDDKYDRDRDEAVYWNLLKQKIVELNENISNDDAQEIVDNLKRNLGAENLLDANEEFYEKMRDGVPHTVVDEDGEEKSEYIDLIHLPEDESNLEELMEKNEFVAINQFQFERKKSVRPDITLLVNGIPIVQFELKNVGPSSTIQKAMNEMDEYQENAQRMFVPNLFNVVSDGQRFRYAATGAPQKFYFPWRSESFKEGDYEVKNAITDLFQPDKLMDLFRYYVFFSDEGKIVPRYMQFQASNRMIERMRKGEPRKGLIWHTQGSGKSFTMMFAAHKAKKSPSVKDRQQILVVDRTKLEGQMSDDLHDIGFPIFEVADTINDLENILEENKNQLVLTTIQKFENVNSHIDADPEGETAVYVDEAHRFTEGKLGSKLRNALPDAFYFGFTGTPVVENSKDGRNTFKEFSPTGEDYLHRYSIEEGQRDGVITEVTFTKMNVDWGEIPEEILDQEFEGEFGDLPLPKQKKILREYVNESELAELRPRVEKVVRKILDHFESKVEPINLKGMVVTPSRRAAAIYCDELRKYRDSDEVEAIISGDGKDDDFMQKYIRSEEDEKNIIENFKDDKKDPQLLVVCDKLLTGFDAPVLKTLYLDKNLNNHNLLQAIARTNRPRTGKKNGEIVDFAGVFDNPEEALQYEEFNIIKDGLKETDELAEEFLELQEEILNLFEIRFRNDPETIQSAVASLRKNDSKASRFLEMFSEAEDIYESVQPHEKLGEDNVIAKWKIINQVYFEYKEMEKGARPEEGKISGEVREKTREILEENLEVNEIETEEEDVYYEIGTPEVKHVEDQEPEYKAAAEGAVLEENVEVKAQSNPAYESLSERVKQIIQDWKDEDINAEQAIQEYEEVRKDIEELESEQQRKKMDDVSFSIYQLLTDRYSEYFTPEGAEEIAESISESTESLDFNSVESTLRKSIRRRIIQELVAHDFVDVLAQENKDEFLSKTVDLVIKNR